MDQRVAVEEQMLEIRDRPWHWVQLANLFRLRSQIHPIVAPGDIEASRSDLQRAIDALEKAINANEFIASQKNPEQVRADFAAKIKEWRNELTGTETDADENANETSGTAEAAAGSNDVESRRKLVGVWTQNKFGNRTLTIAGDGTGLMTMEPEAIYAVLYGSKLTFKMYWSVKDGFINYGYRSGTPTDKVRMAAETIGDHWIEKIIELTDNRLVLLEADGTTKSIWDRKPSRGGPPGANQAQRPGR